jgi:hypothetical protein
LAKKDQQNLPTMLAAKELAGKRRPLLRKKVVWQEWPVLEQIARVNGSDKNPPPQLIATEIISDVVAVAH